MTGRPPTPFFSMMCRPASPISRRATITAAISGPTSPPAPSGALYGSQLYTDADSGTFKTITLDSALLADLNAAIAAGHTEFAIGGPLGPVGVVPAPGTLAMLR